MIFLVAFAALAVYGLLTPTITHKFSVQINRPVIPVFTKLASVNDMPQWIRGLDRVEPKGFHILPGLPTGSYDLFYSKGTLRREFQLDILNVDPLSSVKVRMSNDLMEIDCTARFSADRGSTILKLEAVAKGKGVLARMMLPLAKWRLESETEENIHRLKTILENS